MDEVEQRNQAIASIKETFERIKETTDKESVDVDVEKSGDIEERYALIDAFAELEKYNDSEQKSILSNSKNKIAYTYSDILDFIKKSKSNENDTEFLFIGKMNAEIASFIEHETGINVKEKSIALSSDNIRHIFNNHGEHQNESLRGQIQINVNNIENIIETIIDPDVVKKEVNKDQSISILFEKNLYGRNLAVTVLSNKKNTLTLQSARIYRKGISSPSNARASLSTSKTVGGMNHSSTTIIRENSEKSIENTKKVEKRFSLDGEQGKPDYVTALRKYLHRLNISDDTKADMVEAFGEKRTRALLNIWENTDAKEKGGDIPTAHKQLWKDGFRTLKRQTNAKKPMYEHRLS